MRPIQLGVDTFGTLWDYYELGTQHPVLAALTPVRTGSDRVLAERRALDELDDAGLLHRGNPAPDLTGTLRLLAAASLEFYGWIGVPPRRTVGALLAAAGRTAVLAVRDGPVVRLREAPPEPDVLLGLLDAAPRAAGRAINVLAADLDAGGRPTRTEEAEYDPMREVAPSRTDSDRLAALLRRPRVDAGLLNVARRVGPARRTAAGLGYFDVGAGRWVSYRQHDRAGREWVVTAPATDQLMLEQLHRFADGLR